MTIALKRGQTWFRSVSGSHLSPADISNSRSLRGHLLLSGRYLIHAGVVLAVHKSSVHQDSSLKGFQNSRTRSANLRNRYSRRPSIAGLEEDMGCDSCCDQWWRQVPRMM